MSEAVPKVPRPERPLHPPEEGDATPPLITLRALLLGLVTIAGTFYYIIQIAQKQGSGTYVQSQYPMSAFMPFVLWLFVNAALALILPRLSLRRGEMLTIFSMTWVVAVTPMWINFWASLVSAPSYFADEENRWADILFGHLPWQVFVPPTSRVVDNLWNGLPQGMSVPWDGWVGTVVQWLGATGAATVFGYCLLVVFRHQWQENEKLPYPLAQLPRDLTAGFEQKRRLPQIFRSKLFWIGFAVVIVPQIHNIVTYFVPGLPTFGLFWNYYRYWFDHGARLRLHPGDAADTDGGLPVPGPHPGKHRHLPRPGHLQDGVDPALRGPGRWLCLHRHAAVPVDREPRRPGLRGPVVCLDCAAAIFSGFGGRSARERGTRARWPATGWRWWAWWRRGSTWWDGRSAWA